MVAAVYRPGCQFDSLAPWSLSENSRQARWGFWLWPRRRGRSKSTHFALASKSFPSFAASPLTGFARATIPFANRT